MTYYAVLLGMACMKAKKAVQKLPLASHQLELEKLGM
jgi:hypothetical protein